jgi:hypothetical protein
MLCIVFLLTKVLWFDFYIPPFPDSKTLILGVGGCATDIPTDRHSKRQTFERTDTGSNKGTGGHTSPVKLPMHNTQRQTD